MRYASYLDKYKKAPIEPPKLTFWQRLRQFIMSSLQKLWGLTKKSSGIIATGFIVMVLPSLAINML